MSDRLLQIKVQMLAARINTNFCANGIEAARQAFDCPPSDRPLYGPVDIFRDVMEVIEYDRQLRERMALPQQAEDTLVVVANQREV